MEKLMLHDFHEELGARFTTVGGAEVVAGYADALSEHGALLGSAGMIDLSFRSRLCLTGSDRVRFLHGQVTNDVKALRTGQGCYAALITAKGKMQSDLNIYSLQEELLLDCEPGLTRTISERLEKYVIADDVQIVDVAPHYGLMSIQGPRAGQVLASLGLAEELPGRPFEFVKSSEAIFGEVYLMNQPRLGTSGFDLFIPTAALRDAASKLLAGIKTVEGGPCGWEAFEMARIEAGIPRFGADMDESNLPLEAKLEDRAVSFSKGCYIGQEVISRIRTYGQVAKALSGLRLGDGTLPARGDKLFQASKEVGYITSAVASLVIKGNIALGYVRKEVNQIGAELTVRTAGGDNQARIVELPFKGN